MVFDTIGLKQFDYHPSTLNGFRRAVHPEPLPQMTETEMKNYVENIAK